MPVSWKVHRPGEGQAWLGNLEALAKWNSGGSQGGAVVPRKEEIRAPTGHRTPRALASKRRGGAVLLGWARSSHSHQIMTVIKIINTKANSPVAVSVRTRGINNHEERGTVQQGSLASAVLVNLWGAPLACSPGP